MYRIVEYELIASKYGEACILTLEGKDSEEATVVWGPQRMAKKLATKHYDFVLNEELGQSKQTGNPFFKFTLM